MSFAHGKTCEVVVDGLDMTELFKSSAFTTDVDTAESTVFRKDDKTYEVGQRASTISLDGQYDEVRQAEVEARFGGLTSPFLATVGPAGLAVGARARMMMVDSTNVTETSGVADMVMLAWALRSTGLTSYGWSLAKPDVLVSGDTAGAAVDTGAAVTGALWVAQFHLITLSATNVVLTVEDSATGSSGWATVSGATSGTLTAAGAVRVAGTGNTKRYVRAVADFTGGASTGKFTVAFARVSP